MSKRTVTDFFDNTLDAWFSKDSEPRKKKILGEELIYKKSNKSLF